jgi:aldehyde oxidoreductase
MPTLPIAWEPLPALIGVEAALAEGATPLHANIARQCADPRLSRDRRRRRGPRRRRRDGRRPLPTGFVEHAYIEPEAGYAVRVGDDRIEITACTQAPYMDQEEVARVARRAEAQVRIRPTACGGGFGGKLDVSIQPLIAVAAWLP